MGNESRREFMKTAGSGLAAGAAVFSVRTAKASPNERIRHAVIGMGGQGRSHVRGFSGHGDICEVAAVCDVDPERRERARGELPDGSKAKAFEDYRRILDDGTIDTVSIATPDHWHAKIAIEAVLAGKHVYVEKPCCHNIAEGRVLVEAAEKHRKCVQHGTQSRSGQGIREAVEYLREGNLGKVRMAKAINHQMRGPIGRAEPSEPPAGVDYGLWLGPAPLHPFTQNRWHYNWHWFWDYGTGDIGNDGIHQIDVARWGLGVELPARVSVMGGQLFYNDDHQTPDTQTAVFDFGDTYLQYEMRLWTGYKMEGHDNGVVFYGDKGTLEVGREGCFATLIGDGPKKIGGGSDFNNNVGNFLACAAAGEPEKLNAPIREGLYSAVLCHLGNIGVRVGRGLAFDPASMRIVDDPEADRLIGREYREGYELPKV